MLQVRVGLFRLKSLAGGTYDALSAPETSTMKQLQVFSVFLHDSLRFKALQSL